MKKNLNRTLAILFLGVSIYACNSDNNTTATVTETSSTSNQSGTGPATSADSKVAFKLSECNSMLPASSISSLPTGSTCGFLTVPERHAIGGAKASDKTIQLAVVKLAAKASNKETDPIVYLHGGPGGTAISEGLEDIAASVLVNNRDVYLVDQRGVGLSKPVLTCPNYKGESEQLLACKKTLIDSDVDLSAYNSLQNAWDFIELRKALKIESWNLFGSSYGTRLATTIMRESEEGIRSVILDGMFPIEVNGMSENAWAIYQTLNQILKNCEASTGCQPQQLKQQIEGIVSKLQNQNKLAQSRAFIQGITAMISESNLLDSINAIENNLDAIEVNSLENGIEEGFYYAMGLSVVCAEEYPFLTHTASPGSNNQAWSEATRLAVDGIYHLGFNPEACKTWDVPAADEVETLAVTSSLPVLILNGQNDEQTPPQWGQLVADNMTMSQIYTNPRGGHGQLAEDSCFDKLIEEFIKTPTNKVNDACVSSIVGTKYTVMP